MSLPPELRCPLASATGLLDQTIHENFSFLDTRKTRQSRASNVPIHRNALDPIITDTPHIILKSEICHFHRLDFTRQAGFVVTIYDKDGVRLAVTAPLARPQEAFIQARRIVDNKVEGP